MALVRLGKMALRWCARCNAPVLESAACGRCGSPTESVEVTPPGDVRPAFEHDIRLIRDTIDRQFGPGTGSAVVPENHVVVLNKAPALDRLDEVIVDGEVSGSLKYDLEKGWVFLPRMTAARALAPVATKGRVTADDGAVKPILGSSNLLGPGVVSCDPGIAAGDETIVLDSRGYAFGAGMARMPSEQMAQGAKGMAVKVRWCAPPEAHSPGKESTWADAIEANRPEMAKRVNEAAAFMKRAIEQNGKPAVISFSGGKDSLAVLILSEKANLDLPIFYIDTGLEFPETARHVREAAARHGRRLIVESAPADAFANALKSFGPPGRDYRWCCKTNKLGPTARAIRERYPDGVLSFIGQRRYESEARSSKPRVWSNPWTPGQIGASPVQSWTALHVWLLIMMEDEPFNPWYERGLDRIGCYLCPASDLGELRQAEEASPQVREWLAHLRQHAQRRNLPDAWVEYGAWRWRRMPQSFRQELDRLGVSTKPTKPVEADDGELRLKLQEGASPCTLGFSIEGAFNRPIGLRGAANVLNILGPVELNEEEGWCSVSNVRLFEEGALTAKGPDEPGLRRSIEAVRRLVLKSEGCIACGVCLPKCRHDALAIERNRIAIDEGRCAHCGVCSEPCPAITFGESFEF